jgi:DNA-binding transcriptional LysR family regulator
LSFVQGLAVCRQRAFDLHLVVGRSSPIARKSGNYRQKPDRTQDATYVSIYHLITPIVVSRRSEIMRRSRFSLDGKAGNKISKSGKIMTDLNSLLIFATVADANSFSEAARRLKMPISTVSRRIAELEDQLGVRLFERSTRNLRLTDVGAEVLEYARRSVEISEALDNVVSNRLSKISGLLRLSAPPSISDTMLEPLVRAFQASYPDVRIKIFVTDRYVDHIAEGIDLVFRIGAGAEKDSSLVAKKIMTYRHRLLASPAYIEKSKPIESPRDLLDHRLLAFAYLNTENSWTFYHVNGTDQETLSFSPHLSMNDFTGLASALVAGRGIGDLPPVVRPELVRDGRLVEVMPDWRFRSYDLLMVHLGNRHVTRTLRVLRTSQRRWYRRSFPTYRIEDRKQRRAFQGLNLDPMA